MSHKIIKDNQINNAAKNKKDFTKKLVIIISIIAVLAVVLIAALVITKGGSDEENTTEPENTTQAGSSEVDTTKPENTVIPENICQYSDPVEGEIVAEIYIKDFGVVKVKFFETLAPKAVENFITHAKEGYYDGVTFHRVMDDFMIQGGDPTGTGMGGESIWNSAFEDEFSTKLMPIRGALCMANAGANTNGSQFFIVQTNESQPEYAAYLEALGVDSDLVDYYEANGGAAWLYGAHTVFGQVFEGMDVVDNIAKVETDLSNNKPLEDVVIEKILVKEY